jgi:hypothetical protein
MQGCSATDDDDDDDDTQQNVGLGACCTLNGSAEPGWGQQRTKLIVLKENGWGRKQN